MRFGEESKESIEFKFEKITKKKAIRIDYFGEDGSEVKLSGEKVTSNPGFFGISGDDLRK